jgi:hypothetical protein
MTWREFVRGNAPECDLARGDCGRGDFGIGRGSSGGEKNGSNFDGAPNGLNGSSPKGFAGTVIGGNDVDEERVGRCWVMKVKNCWRSESWEEKEEENWAGAEELVACARASGER